MKLEDIIVDDIDFIKIDRLVETKDAEYLEYTIWMVPVDLGLVGYKIVQEVSEAFKQLRLYNNEGVMADYHLEELKNMDVLTGLRFDRTTLNATIKEGTEVRKIEFKPDDKSIYNILYKINNNKGRIKSIDADQLSPTTMLQFNNHNFNISHRYFDRMNGFRTYFITLDDKVRDFEVETIGKVNIINRMEKDLKNGRYQYLVSGEDLNHRAYDFYFDGKLFNRQYIHIFLSPEVLINHSARSFKSLICKKTCDAIYQVTAGVEPKKFISTGQYYRVSREKKCTIEHIARIISTTRLTRLFREYELDVDYDNNVVEVIKHLKSSYTEQTYGDVVDTLNSYTGLTKSNRLLKTRLDSISLGVLHVENSLRMNCLKQVISGNEFSDKIYGYDKQMLESFITDAKIYFQLHQSKDGIVTDYIKELMSKDDLGI